MHNYNIGEEQCHSHIYPNSKEPKYQKRYNLRPIFRGDSLVFPSFVFDFSGDQGIEIVSQACDVKNSQGDVILSVNFNINGNRLSAQPIDTSGLSTGTFKYDIQVLLNNGVTRTYIYGDVTLKQDITEV